MVNSVLPLILITFKEGVRHRIIFGAFMAALLLVFFSVFFCGLFMRDLLKVLVDVCLAAISISGLLVPLFFSISQFSGDIEKKTIYSIISRSISRGQYLLGRFLGLNLLAFAIMAILLGATFVSLEIARTLYSDAYFSGVSVSSISLAAFTAFLSVCLLNAAVVFWTCITTSSFLATLLTLSTYAIGHTIEDLVRFVESQGHVINITMTTKYTLIGIMYVFPNFATFDKKQLAAHGLPISLEEVLLLTLYCLTYSTVLIYFSIFFFKKRDL